MAERMSFDEYFMNLANLASKRSTCIRRQVGAIIVKGKSIVSTGYNGAPRGIKHCAERPEGCLRNHLNIPSGTRQEVCLAAHAESNAIVQAARHGVNIDGSTIYTTLFPCSYCARMIMNAGIKEIVYIDGYPDELSKRLLEESGIKIRKIEINNKSDPKESHSNCC